MNSSWNSPSGYNPRQVRQTMNLGRTSDLHMNANVQPGASVPQNTAASSTAWSSVLAEMMAPSSLMQVDNNTSGNLSTPQSANSGLGTSFGSGISSLTSFTEYWLLQLIAQMESTGVAQSLLGHTSTSGPLSATFQPSLDANGQIGASPETASGMSTPSVPTHDIQNAIAKASAHFGLPVQLIDSVIRTESSYQPSALSSTGAMGLMQLMPQTAEQMGVQNPYDPVQNIWGGTRYLSSLVQQFHGDLKLAVAAYNAGPQAVLSHGGVPPYPETEQYVQKVLGGAGINV